MKRLLFYLIFLIIGNFVFSQAYTNSINNQEVKFNIGHFLATTTVEGSYEYYLNDDTSLGGTIYFNGDATDYNGNFGIGPNLRAYFGYQPRSGFFAELFGLYYTGENEQITQNLGNLNNDYNTLAIGLGAGGKLTTFSQKFIIEINAGFGRNLNPLDFQNNFMFRAGLSVGFRF